MTRPVEAVLVCTDFSTAAAAGEREALRRYPKATIVVLHVADRRRADRIADVTGLDRSRLLSDITTYADQRLGEIVRRMQSQGHHAIAELVQGDPIQETLAVARKHQVHTIILGVSPHEPIGRFRTLLSHRIPLPLLLVPGEEGLVRATRGRRRAGRSS